MSLVAILAFLAIALSVAVDAPVLWFVGACLLGVAVGVSLGGRYRG